MNNQQESIPLGCVPSAFVSSGGGRVSLVLCNEGVIISKFVSISYSTNKAQL